MSVQKETDYLLAGELPVVKKEKLFPERLFDREKTRNFC